GVVGGVAGGRGSPAGGVRAWTPADVAELAAFVARAARPRRPAAGAAGATGERPGPAGARVCGLVLAGGRSRRMGRDKAGLEWRGRTWLDRVRAAVAEATGAPPLVVGRRGPAGSLVRDLLPGSGPLAGVVSGAYGTRAPWMLVVACDMPFLTSEALQPLLERLPAAGCDADAVVPVVDGRRQLTCALYARRQLHAAVARLAEGRRGLHAWLDGLRVVEVGEDAWTRRGLDPRIALADVDDPDTWKRVAGVAAPPADA
ncbi:MAG: molybdenum cofactor guanylyltransferase, partial [Clostridia bacterium]|nr:molybdenum cofactor guanylyltransferase [Clostridia bacterium]